MTNKSKRRDKALEDAKAAVARADETVNQLRAELAQCRKDHQRACVQAGAAKDRHDVIEKQNKRLETELRHQQRLVRTLTDALADKYHPIPTEIKVQMAYRVAEPNRGAESEQ